MSDLQFTITRDEFADAINWVARALPAKPLNPLLGAIRLTSGSGYVILEAFDYEVAAVTSAGADVTSLGTTLVSGRLLQAISKALARKPVEFKTEGGTARILCGAAEFTLPTMLGSEYPDLPTRPADAGSVDAGQFAEAIAQTSFAVHRGDGYSSIKAVCFDVDPLGGLTLSATDRYRVATKTIPWQPTIDSDGSPPVRLLVPPRALGDTARLGGDTVAIAVYSLGNSGSSFGKSSPSSWVIAVRVSPRKLSRCGSAPSNPMCTVSPPRRAVSPSARGGTRSRTGGDPSLSMVGCHGIVFVATR
ncbi:hypothetical protein A5622_24350 [Mycobacterium sp. 1245801.1]|nr:hypothetical protein [Mycobacterium sp. 1245801.1]OBJ16936.1 hypothetical protein A5622_24350 [Mycobacterium sp. 1245801.1]